MSATCELCDRMTTEGLCPDHGVWTKLVYAESRAVAALGDTLTMSDGEKVTLVAFDRPHKPAASGYIYVLHSDGKQSRYYAGVGGLEFYPRPDRDYSQEERL